MTEGDAEPTDIEIAAARRVLLRARLALSRLADRRGDLDDLATTTAELARMVERWRRERAEGQGEVETQ